MSSKSAAIKPSSSEAMVSQDPRCSFLAKNATEKVSMRNVSGRELNREPSAMAKTVTFFLLVAAA